LGDFSPIGRLFSLGSFFISEAYGMSVHFNFDKKWVGYILGSFSSNSSGHPVLSPLPVCLLDSSPAGISDTVPCTFWLHDSEQPVETKGAVAPCKKMVVGKKAGDKTMERTIIPGQEAI
jgi:hypothetical protein